MKNALRWMVLGLVASTSAHAVVIDGYSAVVNDRFTGTFPSAPVPNSSGSFIGAGYDWSGVGWDANLATRSFALIDDEYFVYATHYPPSSNPNSLNFYSPTLSSVVSYSWTPATKITFQHPDTGAAGDFSIGRLSSPVNPAHGLATYPILDLPSLNAYAGLQLLVYGFSSTVTSPRIGQNQIDGFGSFDVYPLNVGDSVEDTFVVFHYDNNQPGNAIYQVGDSSGPLFVPFQGELTIVGTHSLVGTANGKPANFDNFIPIYLDQMTAQNVSFTTVPEVPALAGSAVLALAALRYRRWMFRA